MLLDLFWPASEVTITASVGRSSIHIRNAIRAEGHNPGEPAWHEVDDTSPTVRNVWVQPPNQTIQVGSLFISVRDLIARPSGARPMHVRGNPILRRPSTCIDSDSIPLGSDPQ